MNTKISAEIVADSITPYGENLTTMRITFPRYILAELNTHRMLSKNSASSRAIPFEKMVKAVEENPFIPIAWQKDHKGMQGTEYFNTHYSQTNDYNQDIHYGFWMDARDEAIRMATCLHDEGLTKQLCNRLLEPFMWHTVLISGTEWENFFELRCPEYHISNIPTVNKEGSEHHKHITLKARSKKDLIKSIKEIENPIYDDIKTFLNDLTEIEWLQRNKGQAEIHMMALAEAMWDAKKESTPKELKAGEWHIPFYSSPDAEGPSGWIEHCNNNSDANYHDVKAFENWRVKVSTARCARVSYTVVGEENKKPNYENDIKLHDRLAESGHWSPFEHCARVMDDMERAYYYTSTGPTPDKFHTGVLGNFRGFIQYRKMFENENIL